MFTSNEELVRDRITPTRQTIQALIRWVHNSKMSKFVKQVLYAGIAALIYFIWQARNSSYWNDCIASVEYTVKQIRIVVKMRISTMMPQKISRRDVCSFSNL